MLRAAPLALTIALATGCATAPVRPVEDEPDEIEVVSSSVHILRTPSGRVAEVTAHSDFGELLRVLDLLARARVKRLKVVVEAGGPSAEVALVWPKTTQPRLGLAINDGRFAVLAAPLVELRKGRAGPLATKPPLALREDGRPGWDELISAIKAQQTVGDRLRALVIEAPAESEAVRVLEAAQRLGALGFNEGIFLCAW